MLDWIKVSALPWRQRNAEVEVAVRQRLAQFDPPGPPMQTWHLAACLLGLAPESVPKGDKAVTQLSQILVRMAPHLPGIAAHDGPEIIRYGRKWRRWQWYPQKEVVCHGQE